MKHCAHYWVVLLSLSLVCSFYACSENTQESIIINDSITNCPSDQTLVAGICTPTQMPDEPQDTNTPGDITGDDPELDHHDPSEEENTITDPTKNPEDIEDILPEEPDEPEQPPAPVEPAAMVITPVDGLITIQNTLDATFSVSLNREPADDVTITLTSQAPTVGMLSTNALVFHTDNWNNPQQVTIAGPKEALPERETAYKITVGPSQSEDADFDNLDSVDIEVKHYSLPEDVPSAVNPKSLELDKTSADILLLGKSVTITANLDPEATDQTVIWDIQNTTDDVPYPFLVSVKYDMAKHTITLKSNVVLDSPDCKTMHLDYARTLKVTAKHASGLSTSAAVELKPYLPLDMTLTKLKTIRDFNTPGHKNTNPDAGSYEKGELSCHYYDAHTAHVFSKDMNALYVDPQMYKVNGSNYGTRASVLAAARFLAIQFPKDVPYASALMYDNVAATIGRYTMSTYAAAKDSDEYKAKVRIFGLSLLDYAYNSFTSFTDSHIIMGAKGQDKVVPWGCHVTIKGEDKGANGLRCSGYVNWAMRNGRFYLGDWGTVLFAKNGSCKNAKGNYLRNFKCKDLVYKNKNAGSSNPNGQFESAHAKLSQLEEKDFIKVKDLTEKSKFMAGDLLWKGVYNCKVSNNQCQIDGNDCRDGSGHVAMILGISRKDDGNIKYVYVAEATGENGNRLKAYSIEGLKKVWVNKTNTKANKKEGYPCSYTDSRLIKMDNVYNYHHNKTPDKVREDLNTYKYTELWF